MFSDQTTAIAKHAGAEVSRSSTRKLKNLESAPSGLYRQPTALTPATTTPGGTWSPIEDNLDRSLLPAEALARGEITFTHTADGERRTRPDNGYHSVEQGRAYETAFVSGGGAVVPWMTSTGQVACSVHAELTDPSSRPVNPP